MCRYTGTTKGGLVIDESWQPNDGLVNLISAEAPFGAPRENFREDADLLPGRWYVMPVIRGDHIAALGGMKKKTGVRALYLEMTERIAGLSR